MALKFETAVSSISDILTNLEKEYLVKYEKQQQRINELEKENDELKNYHLIDDILDEVEEAESKYTETKQNIDYQQNDDGNDDEEDDNKKKTVQFWTNLNKKLEEGDIEYIKNLVRQNKLSMDESNSSKRTLLMLATYWGSYELVSMCINLGADIDAEDAEKKTALKLAKERGFPDIEELLIMNLLKTELGERIENTTNDLLKKQGITNNFNKILNNLFDEKKSENKENDELFIKTAITNTFLNDISIAYKKELLETMLKIVLKSIESKTAYSDDMLFIVFKYEIYEKKRKPTETLLYKTIKKVIIKILNDTNNKKDWYWMKNYVLSSSIWYLKTDPNDKKSKFLFYNVFFWVDQETKHQSLILSAPMREIENKNITEWNKLINYTISTNYKYDNVRQDVIKRGLKSEYTAKHLTQNVSISATFNPLTHYDLSQYLTKLILICHECDDQFQHDIQRIFNVNKETKENKKLGVLYMRGPVKKLERCFAKCLSDYREEAFPTAAHVLDIVRCSLVFNDVSSTLNGMDLFQRQIMEKKFSILEVVRVKNGFFEYKHEAASYTDIKFNVMIQAKKHNVIGEVQFLIKKMFDYKKIAHSLYSIERTKEFVDDLSELLPIKLDLEKQLFIHAARCNINGLTDLMVTHNFNGDNLLQLNQQKQSILTPICDLNCEKALKFLNGIKEISQNKIRERLMRSEQSGVYPLQRAIQNNHFHGVLKYIFNGNKFMLIDEKDNKQRTPLRLTWDLSKGKCSLLILKNVKTWQERLKMIETTGTTTTSLQYALKSGDVDLVKFVFDQLEYNEKLKTKLLSYKDTSSRNNFHFAAIGGNVNCVQLLLSKCKTDQQKNELFAEDNNYTVPAYEATKYGKAELVKMNINDS